ncbi:hypothetical protein Fmac_027494 [Flemingia macrophylla]|uniref:LysM domain-containing protein n=1 Tax=Flemingia macrophylla TaxID=520843 RepID=A0ABD1LHU1_9FABA
MAEKISWNCAVFVALMLVLSSCESNTSDFTIQNVNNSNNKVCDEIYVVREGETLQTISEKCGDPYIVEENPHIHDPDDVFPGLVKDQKGHTHVVIHDETFMVSRILTIIPCIKPLDNSSHHQTLSGHDEVKNLRGTPNFGMSSLSDSRHPFNLMSLGLVERRQEILYHDRKDWMLLQVIFNTVNECLNQEVVENLFEVAKGGLQGCLQFKGQELFSRKIGMILKTLTSRLLAKGKRGIR